MPEKPLKDTDPETCIPDAPGTVTWPWNGKQTGKIIDVLVGGGVGFRLDNRGVTVQLSDNATEEQARSLMAELVNKRCKTR